MSEMSAKEKHEAQQTATRAAVTKAASKVVDGVITVGPEPYEAAIAEGGWTKDDVKRLRRITTDYIGAAHQSVGEIAISAMAKDKELPKVIANIDLSTFGDVTSVVNRVHVGNNPKTQEQVVTYGTSVAKVSILSGSNKSALNVACEAVKALAADKLK